MATPMTEEEFYRMFILRDFKHPSESWPVLIKDLRAKQKQWDNDPSPAGE